MRFTASRSSASVPTLDTERRALFQRPGAWTPSGITLLDHDLAVDIPTGNLVVTTNDVGYPYYDFSLGTTRRYDAQEQWMARSYFARVPNVDPHPHWFGNWSFAYEANVEEVWNNTLSQLQILSGIGARGLFETHQPDFLRHLTDGIAIESLLRSYGIPGRTLATLAWTFKKNDLLLRTHRGTFQLLSGRFDPETLVDDVGTELWLFSAAAGIGFRISSLYCFNLRNGHHREKDNRLLVTDLVDALGHTLTLRPVDAMAPYVTWQLTDRANRVLTITLDTPLAISDGLNPTGDVRWYLVSKVLDNTKSAFNQYSYVYGNEALLREVILPSSIGDRRTIYHYEDFVHPGILTAIENPRGERISLSYFEDTTDLDERLNPRLKIKQITDTEGNTFDYDYHHIHSYVMVTVSKDGSVDRKVRYEYMRDTVNTKRRYPVAVEVEVRRGYTRTAAGGMVSRDPMTPQRIRRTTAYTSDGRFNVARKTDALGRSTSYEYNDFGQVVCVWDVDNHWTRNTYDIPSNPSPGQPVRYDLVAVKRENLIRNVAPGGAIAEVVQTLVSSSVYGSYDVNNSIDAFDAGRQSTHRITQWTDEHQKVWCYTYDDALSFNPLSPTTILGPLGNLTSRVFGKCGEVLTVSDTEGNVHTFRYSLPGLLAEYIDPNRASVKLTYYPCGNWLCLHTDQLSKVTEFVREADGRLIGIKDPVGDTTEWRYFRNGRVRRVVTHRPPVPKDPAVIGSPSFIQPIQDLVTDFTYSPLGSLASLTNPLRLTLRFLYDEDGRLSEWFHDVPNVVRTKYAYDMAGQLLARADRMDRVTTYEYHKSGYPKTIKYPDWDDGRGNVVGKRVDCPKYDYLGRLLSVIDSELGGTQEYIYDLVGNLRLRRDFDNWTMSFDYDDERRLERAQDDSMDYQVKFQLDTLGRPRTLQDAPALDGAMQWTMAYSKQVGGLLHVLSLFERRLSAAGLVSTFDYDARGSLTKVEHAWCGSPASVIQTQSCTYRDDGLLDTITGDDANAFRYDGLKQLVYEAQGNCTAEYDAVGNRLYHTDITMVSNPPTNVHDVLNRLQQEVSHGDQFTYDAAGNAATSTAPVNPTQYFFDGVGRLRVVRNATFEVTNVYDPSGRLVDRKIHTFATGVVDHIHFQYIVTRPARLIRNGLPCLLLTWDQEGRLLRTRRYNGEGAPPYPNSFLPLYGRLGSVLRWVDVNRNMATLIHYNAWGERHVVQDPLALSEVTGYRDAFFDVATGLNLFGARWYMPQVGRWVSEEPSQHGDAGMFHEASNLYTYTLNNPVNMMDLSGMQTSNEGSWNPCANDPRFWTLQYKILSMYAPGLMISQGIERMCHAASGKEDVGDIKAGASLVHAVVDFIHGMHSAFALEGLLMGTAMGGIIVSGFELEESINDDFILKGDFGAELYDMTYDERDTDPLCYRWITSRFRNLRCPLESERRVQMRERGAP